MTLMEVLMAMVLLSFGLAGVIEFHLRTMQQAHSTRMQSKAGALARGRLAELRATPYGAWTARLGESGRLTLPEDGMPAVPQDNAFRWRVLARREAGSGDAAPARLRLEVEIRWLERGLERSLREVAYVPEP